MALTKQEEETIANDLDYVSTENLRKLRASLEHYSDILEDMNSQYPATQEFLKLHGKTHVRELDQHGRQELLEYLHKTLQKYAH